MTCIDHRDGRRIASFQTTAAARRLLTTAIAMASVLPASLAQAAPAGGVVTAGAGTISQQGATTTINQSATQPQGPARMVINWNSFTSAAGESIVFNQPNAAAIALNRVTGANPSQLMGNLTANGQVFILNPNGVLFGTGSQVNVRGLLASTLGMDTAGFMAGTYALQGSSSARVVNQGTLKAANGGYVALVGPTVVNDGSISASKGDVLLAAGDKVTLRLEGGGLLGYSMDLGSANALVDNRGSGVISANGGRVVLEARAADALSKAVVNHAGLIEAQTLDGSKGSIRLIGDMNVGQTTVSGTLDASAPNRGDGGFIETSAAKVLIADGTKVSTKATAGTLGNWLIDPIDFEIAPGTGARTDSSIGAAKLAAELTNTNTTIGTTTSNAGTGHGDITVNADVAWQGFGKLTLQAHRNIIFNASLGGASVSLLYGQASPNGDGADFYFNNGAKIFLNGVGGTFSTQKGSDAAVNLKNYTIVRSLGTEGATDRSTLQGIISATDKDNYALAADIVATGTGQWNGNTGFSPLASFNGTFQGLGHEIVGLNISRPGSDTQGLFSSIAAGAEVRDLGISKASIVGSATVGALAASNLGTVRYVFVTGKVRGTLRSGGLAGINTGTISNSYSEADVKGIDVTGGLVGENGAGVISNSYASGPVLGLDQNPPAGSFTGGLVGFNRATITGSYANGITIGKLGVGGLVGGNTGVVQDSYAKGQVNGESFVGGLAGQSVASSKIENSYASGEVKGSDTSTTRGLVGASDAGVVSNSYWNTDSVAKGGTGQTTLTPGAGEGKTGAQLQQAATFSGWDIATTGGTEKVWRIYEGNSKPLLRSFLAPLVLGPSSSLRPVYDGTVQNNPAISTAGARTGTAASGREFGTYQPYSNQQGFDISNGELVITPRPLKIEAQIETRVYNGTTTAKATLSDDRIKDDLLTTASTLASFDNKNVGDQKAVTVSGITLGGRDAGNYTFQNNVTATGKITPFNLVFHVAGVDKVYDGTPDTTVLMSAVKVGTEDVFTNRTASFDTKNAGVGKTVTVTVTGLRGADAGNYTFTPPPTTTASITPRPLDITATAADKTYDGTLSARPTLQDNRIAGDALVTNAVASFEDRNAGTGKNVTVSGISISGTDAANYLYKPQVIATTASITPRPLDITATAADKAYDGTTPTSATLADNRLAGDAVTASYQRADFADKNGGEKKTVTVSGIALGGADALNYQANTSTTTSASIKPIGLTIAANPDTRLADGVPYLGGNGVTYAGFIPGETAAVLAGQLRYSGDAQGAMKEGVYRITPGGLTSLNYASTFVDGALTIQPLPPGAGIVAAYTESGMPAPLAYVGRNTGANTLRVLDCGMRLPENLLLGGCQPAAQSGNPGQ